MAMQKKILSITLQQLKVKAKLIQTKPTPFQTQGVGKQLMVFSTIDALKLDIH